MTANDVRHRMGQVKPRRWMFGAGSLAVSKGIACRLRSMTHRRGFCFAGTAAKFSSCRVPNNRFEEGDDVQPTADVPPAGKRSANAKKAADSCQNRQHSKRHPHRRRRLVGKMWDMFVFGV